LARDQLSGPAFGCGAARFHTSFPPFQLPQFLNERGQGLALNKLHGIEMHAALAADEVDGNDVGMLQAGGGMRFVLEALKLFAIQGGGEGQDL
jgi:hypothetical protein